MKAYYCLRHSYRLDRHTETKEIGVYSSPARAKDAQRRVMEKSGFREHRDGFRIRKVVRLFRPKELDRTFWEDGFDTYRC